MTYLKSHYERLSEFLETSSEILYAIEQISDDYFDFIEDEDVFGEKTNEIDENSHSYELWEDGGREDEILAALPTENGGSPIEEGTEVLWGMEGKFAEFDGEKWARTRE